MIDKFSIRLIFILLLFTGATSTMNAQVAAVEFGKNRIQYHDDFDAWSSFESRNFITYWYGKSANVAKIVVKLAETEHDDIMNIIEHQINHKIEIIVYTDLSDLHQSNIGNTELFKTKAEEVKVLGNKVFVHASTNPNDLRRELRSGIANVLLNNMYFDDNIGNTLRGRISSFMPEWFLEGLVSYAGHDWDDDIDHEFKQLYGTSKSKKFYRLAAKNPRVAGHSFWFFLTRSYGRSVVANLLYLTKINKNHEDAFNYVFGVKMEEIFKQWRSFYGQLYKQPRGENDGFERERITKIWGKGKYPTTHARYSPDGQYLLTVVNKFGKAKLFITSEETGEKKRVWMSGVVNYEQKMDKNYPVLAWLPSSREFALIFEERGETLFRIYDVATLDFKEQLIPERYDRVYDMVFLDDRYVCLSAAHHSHIDLYYYDTKTRQSKQWTDDFYLDLNPVLYEDNERRGLIFSSNRPDGLLNRKAIDSLDRFDDFDLYFLDLNQQAILEQVTHTPKINELEPFYHDGHVSYLSNTNGYQNQNRIQIASKHNNDTLFVQRNQKGYQVFSLEDMTDSLRNRTDVTQVPIYKWDVASDKVNSDYSFPIDVMAQNPRRNERLVSWKQGRKYAAYKESFVADTAYVNKRTPFRELLERSKASSQEDVAEQINRDIAIESKKNKVTFVSRFGKFVEDDEIVKRVVSQKSKSLRSIQFDFNRFAPNDSLTLKDIRIERTRIVPYRLKFKYVDLVFDINNDPLFGGLQSYAAQDEDPYRVDPPGMLGKFVLKDLLEDYRIEVGGRVPLNFRGSEVFIVADNYKRRFDHRYALYRKSFTSVQDVDPNSDLSQVNDKFWLAQYRISYPFDIYRSLRATATWRQDDRVFLGTNVAQLERPTENSQRLGLQLAYVYDTQRSHYLNLWGGQKMKFYVEMIKRFEISLIDETKFNLGKGFMSVIGADVRHAFLWNKKICLAVRGAFQTSIGSENILHQLGGTDNAIIPSFNMNSYASAAQNYAYQVRAPNLRGFKINARSGTSYALINAELRLPIFNMVSYRDIKWSILRDFQLVGFFDLGTAWEGLSPFDEKSPLNTVTIERPPVLKVTVNYRRNPLLMGFGTGVRTSLFGYFVRADYAWGLESWLIQKPRLHLSLGVDF